MMDLLKETGEKTEKQPGEKLCEPHRTAAMVDDRYIVTEEEKMQILPVMWNIDPLDWQSRDTGEIVFKVVTEAKEDAIILLHDCYESSVQAALEIVDILTEEGYVFVTADEILMD